MNKFEYVSTSTKDFDLPSRGTKGSCGYDFHSPISTIIKPGQDVKFSLQVKCQIKEDEFLMVVPRSSLGFKNNNFITLTNTVGIIDSDYYNNPGNEGEISVRLHNHGTNDFIISKNDKLVQGIFVKYDVVDNEADNDIQRIGGYGSTGK